jgi:hypothetical protein
MTKIRVKLERTPTGWSAHCTKPGVIGGLGATKAAALADWKEAMTNWIQYRKENRLA